MKYLLFSLIFIGCSKDECKCVKTYSSDICVHGNNWLDCVPSSNYQPAPDPFRNKK